MRSRYLMPLFCVCLTACVLSANVSPAEEAEFEDAIIVEFETADSTDEDVLVVGGVTVELAEDAEEKPTCESKAACEDKPCKDKPCDADETAVASSKPKKKSSSAVGRMFRSLVPGLKSSKEQEGEFSATHRQVALLKVKPSESKEGQSTTIRGRSAWAVKSFCLDSEDNLLVAVGDEKAGELQLIDSAGERLQAWQIPMVPEAINVDPDGNFLVAGAGQLMKLDKQGEVLLEAESPLVAYLKENQDAMRKEVIDQMKSRRRSYTQMTDTYQRQIDQYTDRAARRLSRDDHSEYELLKKRVSKLSYEDLAKLPSEQQNAWAVRKVLLNMLESKVEAKLTSSEKRQQKVYQDQIKMFEQLIAQQGSAEPTEEEIQALIKSSMAYKSRIASISSAGGEFFIATGAVAGYGYDVWRFDAKMENPEKIVTQLRGCCGQMDVQACESGLFVAENSRHQVRHFDFKGEKVNEWGSRAREGVRGFGSCCNPMNVAFGPDGTVYTAESGSGRIKRYSAEGELMDLVGSVELVPGCKKVSIAVTKDHKRVYMLDITRNHIIVMEAKPKEQQVASNDAVKSAS